MQNVLWPTHFHFRRPCFCIEPFIITGHYHYWSCRFSGMNSIELHQDISMVVSD